MTLAHTRIPGQRSQAQPNDLITSCFERPEAVQQAWRFTRDGDYNRGAAEKPVSLPRDERLTDRMPMSLMSHDEDEMISTTERLHNAVA